MHAQYRCGMRIVGALRPVGRPSALDLSIGGGVAIFGLLQSALGDHPDSRVTIATAALLVGAALPWRRSAPLLVILVLAVVGWVTSSVPDEAHTPFFLADMLAVYSVAAYSALRGAIVGLGVMAIFSYGLGWAVDQRSSDAVPFGELVFALVIAGGAWGFGRLIRERREKQEHLEDRAALLEREAELEAKAAVADERARIARELHDVIAHSVSVMVVQAGAAGEVLDRDPAGARRALASIEETGRQAVVELRRLLGVMRRADEEALLAPQPSLRQIDALLEHTSGAGLPVDVEIAGEPRPLEPGVDLAAYRIVQEALTNTLRHAGPARARVAIRYGVESVDIEVTDTGRGSGRSTPGHGLIGMRERVALYGGRLEVASADGGGFVVRATMPAGKAVM